MALKHVGRIKNNKRKVVVAYRVVPNEPDNCVVVTTENLMAEEHDTLMKAVESDAGQRANEFAEVMARTTLPDGRNMLAGFHTTGKMVKMPTDSVEMTPDRQTVISLAELNQIIAEQKGVTVADLALKGASTQETQKTQETESVVEPLNEAAAVTTDGLLTDEDLAAQYRSQADSLFKEAKRLRDQAEELVPTKKKSKVKEGA